MLSLAKPFSNDISRRHAGILFCVVFFGYIMASSAELFWTVDYLDYNRQVLAVAEWQPHHILERNSLHVRYALDKASIILFDSPKVIPFLSSAALLGVVYLMGREISGRYLGGIIAMAILSGNNLFRLFDTSGVYENYWVLFYVLSLYVLPKRWYLSPMFFILGVFSKPLVVMFLPTTFLWITFSVMPKRNKTILALSYGLLVAAAIGTSTYMEYGTTKTMFDHDLFVSGLTSWWFSIVPDWWMPAAVPAMMMMLAALASKRVRYAGLVLAGLLNAALTGIVQAFAYDVANEPYRFIPVVVFFALSIPVLFRVRRKVKP